MNATGCYILTAMALHWLLAGAIAGTFATGLFFAVPLAGWAYSSAAGFPIVLFGALPLPDFVPVSRESADVLKPVHHALAYGLATAVALHVAAALKHPFVDRDGLLSRVWPSRH